LFWEVCRFQNWKDKENGNFEVVREAKLMEIDVFKLPVHPAAELFPMLDSEELRDLADDIKSNGLNHPIVVGKIGSEFYLIDGRNRRAACEVAGVVPDVVEFTGSDASAFIISENINRRHMTKGQRAMAVAMIYPDGEKGGRGKVSMFSGEFSKYMQNAISEARTILSYAPDAAQSVLAGGTPLTDAYKTAQSRKRDADSDDARLNTLKAEAPDLAELVIEGKAKLSEQWEAFKARKEAEKANRLSAYKLMASAFPLSDCLRNEANVEHVVSLLRDPEFSEEFKSTTGRHVGELVDAMRKINRADFSALIGSR